VCPQCEHPCEESHKFCPVCGFPISEITNKTDDPLINTTLPGGYVILELVGVGGMGRVYRAEQKALGRTVAVKIVHPHLLGDESASARFITEARAASRLNHPNSVGVIDFGKSAGGQLYLVMEFLRGRDLARVAYEDGFLSFTRIVDVMAQVLAALDEAHHLGIIHRDLKPENIVLEPMRSGGDFVKVVDFGLAKMKLEATTGITSPGLVCGTPDYMAPEQGRGDPIDARSDLYACGVILFQLLTGRLPFEAESPTQVVLMHLSAPPPNPRTIAPERDIPEVLVEITLKALSKRAQDRYQSAEEFIGALKAAHNILDRQYTPTGPAIPIEHTLTCSSCGASVPLGQKFCGECGSRVTAPPLHIARSAERAAVNGSPASAQPRLPLAFAGREDDLDWLDVLRAEVGTTITTARLIGDHGVGKSRLLTEFLRTAAGSGDIVVRTQPDPWWSEVGYFTLRQAIVRLANLPASGGKAADWSNTTPEARRGLQEIFGQGDRQPEPPPPAWVTDPGELSIEGRRFMAAEALRWAIAKAHDAAKKHRVILAIDDLHAVDGASRNAFADVISEPPLVGMLIVAAHPPDFEPNWGGATRTIGGLPLSIAASLAKGLSPSRSGGKDTKTVSPMYVEQLVRFNSEGGGEAAPRLGDIIATRIERLSAEGRRLLQTLAVLGDDTETDLIVEVMGAGAPPSSDRDAPIKAPRSQTLWGGPASKTRLNEIVQGLVDSGMLERREPSNGSGGKLAIVHPLVRDVTLAMIPLGVKRDLHAAAFADDNGDPRQLPTEVLAMHAFHAQNSFEALMMLETVANRATWRGDLQGAVLSLRRALDLARREISRGEIDDPVRAVLIFSRKLGEALARAGSLSDASGVLKEALDLTGPSGPDRVQVLGALAYVARERARPTEAKKHLQEAIYLAKESLQGELVDSLEKARREWRLS
jgi:serine/threonine protein kinase